MTGQDLPALQTVRAGGRVIAYREAGFGPAVLALHGIGSGSASWAAQLDALASRFRFIAWDAPGYGGSDPLPGDTPAASDYGDAAAALLDALAIDKVHLLGHSMGALIAAAFCRFHPQRLLSVVLADAATGYANAAEEIRVRRLEARIAAMAKDGPEAVAARRAREVLSPGASDALYEKIRAVQSKVRPDGYAQAARMLHGSDIHADAATIAVPALMMCGSADFVTPEETCRRIAETIPFAGYRSLEGLGHASHVEGPEIFNAALTAFIEPMS